MVITSVNQVDKERQKEIVMLFERGISIGAIADYTGYLYNDILAILTYRGKKINELEPYISEYAFKDKKIIFASDMHLGSVLVNRHYLDLLYEYAAKYNIHKIIIVGDFFNGSLKYTLKSLKDPKRQVDYVLDNYPYDENIQNYILFGNHDYNLLQKDEFLIEELNERPDFTFLGIKNTYINWRGFYFRLVHDVKNYHMALPNCHYVKYRFFGHSHEYNQNSKAIWLPPFSNPCPNIAGKQQPGFMVIGVRNGVMEAQKMVVTNNNVSRGPILRKEIL